MESKWHIFHTRYRTPFYVALYTDGLAHGNRRLLDFDYHGRLYHINGQIAMREKEWRRRQREAKRRLAREPRFLLRLMRVSYADYRRLRPRWQALGRTNNANYSNKELAGLLRQYARSMSYFWCPGLTPLYVEDYLTDLVRDTVSAKFAPDKVEWALSILLNPFKEGIIGQEYRSLHGVACLPRAKQSEAIERHWRSFGWMANQLYTNDFFSVSYYEKRLAKITQKNAKVLLRTHRQEHARRSYSFRKVLKELNIDSRTRTLIQSLNEAIFYRSWRGERGYESGFLVAPLFHEIAGRLNIAVDDFLYCLPIEIDRWLRRGEAVPNSEIIRRKNGFVYLPYVMFMARFSPGRK